MSDKPIVLVRTSSHKTQWVSTYRKSFDTLRSVLVHPKDTPLVWGSGVYDTMSDSQGVAPCWWNGDQKQTSASGARSKPVTAWTGKGSKVIGRQGGTGGEFAWGRGGNAPPVAEKVNTLSLIITCLVYIAPIKYTCKKTYLFNVLCFFNIICNGTQPVAMRAPSFLQVVIQLTTFLLYNE